MAGASVTYRDDFNHISRTPYVASVDVAHTRTSKWIKEPIPVNWREGFDYYEQKEMLVKLAHHWFFSAVHLSLCMLSENQSAFHFTRAPVYEDRENISGFLDALSEIGAKVADRWWRGEFVGFHDLFKLFEPVPLKQFRQNHLQASAAKDFRSALHRIACDIHLGSSLMCNQGDIALTEEAMDLARQCSWFDGSSFRAQYVSGTLVRMTDKAATAFVRAERSLFNAEVREETSVYLQIPLQLCSIAINHNMTLDANELCKQTWELTTGFGRRKDPTLSNTVVAIGYLADVAVADARRLLGRIAPQIHHVLNYTDGKGTRHVIAQADRLLAKLHPSALVTKYEEHIDAGDWSLAEDSLLAYVEQGVTDGWPLESLMRTGLHLEIRNVLQRLAYEGSIAADKLFRILNDHNGWDLGLLQREEHTENRADSKPYEGDVKRFEPECLEDLLKSISEVEYNERTTLIRAWYQHWNTNGQGRILLNALEELLLSEQGRHKDILCLSDLAFQTKRKLSGAKAAWKYLVRAQILKGGWGTWRILTRFARGSIGSSSTIPVDAMSL